jgi:glycosyltransferase involved in cell wall biosynthesis
MHYVFVDDSVPFDGFTPGRKPLGGAEKALIGLAGALGGRGHTVTVLNRAPYAVTADGASYQPLDDLRARPLEADVVVAFRQPSLLGAVRKAKHRLLWAVAAPAYLDAAVHAPLWDSFQPTLLFSSPLQRDAYRGRLPHYLLRPGVARVFHHAAATDDGEAHPPPAPVPPHAVVTTHPLHGTAWITEIWRRLVHPHIPAARLVIYSSLLAKGLREEDIPEAIQPVLERVKAAQDANVVVADPRGDMGMSEVYRASRVHLYPGHVQDLTCWTLAESQAAGMPAVARDIGGTSEHIVNGQSGFLVPDTAAIANVTLEILRNDGVHQALSAAARDVARVRTWDMAAEDLDAIVARLAESPP